MSVIPLLMWSRKGFFAIKNAIGTMTMNTILIEWLIVVRYAHSLFCFLLGEFYLDYFPWDTPYFTHLFKSKAVGYQIVSIPYDSTFGVVSPFILIDGDHKD